MRINRPQINKWEMTFFLAFFISGGCGLIYEVIWGKYLSLFIGSTTYGHMMTLAAFMAGLSAGSFFFGTKVDNATHPLKLYGWIEVAIGLYAILFPILLGHAKDMYFQAAVHFPFGSLRAMGCKLLLSFAMIILPTFLMGGTLPILSKVVIRNLGRVGHGVGLLYFINGLGAVLGALLAGFYMIEEFGMPMAVIVTGLVNVLVGFGMLLVDWLRSRSQTQDTYSSAPNDDEAVVEYSPSRLRLVGLAIFLSGFTSMVYEVIWTRFFAVVLGSSTYSFSLMLAAFISGITFGSLAATRITGRTMRYLLAFGLAEVGIALSVLAGFPFYERLPYLFWKLRYLLRPVPETLIYYHAIKFALCFVIMFFPTMFFGLTLPLASKIVSTDMGRLGRKIGWIYSANTLGTLLGALATGLCLFPWLGLQRCLEAAAVVNLLLGAVIVVTAGEINGRALRWAPAAVGALAMVFHFIMTPAWNPLSYSWGQFRSRSAPPATYAAFLKKLDGTVRYYKEDFNCNIAVLETLAPGEPPSLCLTVNGKPDASSTIDMPTQILLGQLPMLFHRQAENVLVVGLGSGVTAGTALAHTSAQVDAVEISPAVAEAVRFFKTYNNDVLGNARFHLIIEDAKTYIRVAPKAYDVVISEPSNPWVAGVGNLFSVEFFEDVARHLKPDGLMVQWFHNYEMTSDITAMVVKTMNAVFPHIYIFQGSSKDIILLGTRTALQPDFQAMAAKLASEPVRQELAKIGILDLPTLLALQMLTPSRIAEITMQSEVNRDDRPLLEYRAPRAFYLGVSSNLIYRSDLRFGARNDLFLSQYMAKHPLTTAAYRNLLRFFRNEHTRNDRLAYSICERLAQDNPEDPEIKLTLANLSFMRGRQERALALLQGAVHEAAPSVALMEQYADLNFGFQIPLDSLFNKQDLRETVQYLRRCLESSTDKDRYLIKLAQTYHAMERYREALPLLLGAEQFRQAAPKKSPMPGYGDDSMFLLIGKTYYQLSDYGRADIYFQKCLETNPGNTEAAYYRLVINDLRKNGASQQAAYLMKR
ncbi:MAG: fused MFS/spermidine synthase [Acidobacteria bacterium]|nr:fused MFS/spermidine synthase [Acidobacteriota bacterium]MBI3657994.1 fused MFS/spermidine synthase [Acidobacteriota bacterium]